MQEGATWGVAGVNRRDMTPCALKASFAGLTRSMDCCWRLLCLRTGGWGAAGAGAGAGAASTPEDALFMAKAMELQNPVDCHRTTVAHTKLAVSNADSVFVMTKLIRQCCHILAALHKGDNVRHHWPA